MWTCNFALTQFEAKQPLLMWQDAERERPASPNRASGPEDRALGQQGMFY